MPSLERGIVGQPLVIDSINRQLPEGPSFGALFSRDIRVAQVPRHIAFADCANAMEQLEMILLCPDIRQMV